MWWNSAISAPSAHLFVHAVQVLLAEQVKGHGLRHAGPTLPSGWSRLLIVRSYPRLRIPEIHAEQYNSYR